MSSTLLEAVGVGKRFANGVEALRDVHLEVRRGETLALIGQSGCGKTTLLRLFNRLEEPTTGEIRIHGRPAAQLDPIILRRRTGYVQQEDGLLPHWNVGRNVELVPTLQGWERSRRRARSDELLELVGLPAVRYRLRYPNELSGGQRQRVAFARALAADPEVILLDEPFGALDALTRVELQNEFVRLKTQLHKTMLMVTHDLVEAFRLADRIAVMRRGRVLQEGRPAELLQSPATEYVRELLAHARGLQA
ncbi:MAG: ATP-binding cassette domain-containing protein [Candidatus Krumholzibacteriia bacterium]